MLCKKVGLVKNQNLCKQREGDSENKEDESKIEMENEK